MSKQNSVGYPLSDTVTIHDLRTAQNFLSSYDCSSATIGIQNYLVRGCENEQFIKFSQQGIKTEDFLVQLDEKEKALSNKCQLDIERCAMITRLRRYLGQNGESFQNILNQIQAHLHQSMQEYSPPSLPKTYAELMQQCQQRNEDAKKLKQAHRMGRLQFHDNNPTKPSMNVINLQKWILTHSKLFMNITPEPSNRSQLIENFQTLLNNSFFIIQHPSPPIATHSTRVNGGVTAKINCRVICLLDRSQATISIDNITPFVHRLTIYNQAEEPDTVYQQPELKWKTYSMITASNNYRTFLCADLSEISLKHPSTVLPNQKPSTVKAHYAPLVYRIDFCINVTFRFANDQTTYQTCVTVQSAPFGLVSHTSQEEDLFARVFIEDLRYWKSWQTTLTTVSNDVVAPLPVTNLTIEDIVDSINRYFIHKTGIRPREWIMPYIKSLFQLERQDQSGLIESFCHNYLVKILAQIDYMTKHPLLSLFHNDGLFLGICDDDLVNQILLNNRQYCQKSICAIRFGAMNRMVDLKEIGIRVIIVDKSSQHPQRWKFDTTKLSMELGLYIIKIALCEASRFDSVLTNLYSNISQSDQNMMTNITKFVELYHSDKLLAICPHEERYPSIWIHTYNNQTVTTEVNNNSGNNPYAIDQSQSYYHEQLPGILPNMPQYSSRLQNIQTNIQSSPIIIVVANPYSSIMSNQDVILLANNHLPQFSQLFQSSPIYRIDTDQTFTLNSTPYDASLNLFDH